MRGSVQLLSRVVFRVDDLARPGSTLSVIVEFFGFESARSRTEIFVCPTIIQKKSMIRIKSWCIWIARSNIYALFIYVSSIVFENPN